MIFMETKEIYEDILKNTSKKMSQTKPEDADYIECKRILHLTILSAIYGKYFEFQKENEEIVNLVTDNGEKYPVEFSFLEKHLNADELNKLFDYKNIKQEEVKELVDTIPNEMEIPEINEDIQKVTTAEPITLKATPSYEELISNMHKDDVSEQKSFNASENEIVKNEIKKDSIEKNTIQKSDDFTADNISSSSPNYAIESEKPKDKIENKQETNKKRGFKYVVSDTNKRKEELKENEKEDSVISTVTTAVEITKPNVIEYAAEIGNTKKLLNTFYYDRYDIKCNNVSFTLNVYPLKRQAIAMLGTMIFVTLYDGNEYFRGYISENEHKTSITFTYNDFVINVTGKWRNGKFITTVMNRTNSENTTYDKTEFRPEKETENTHLIMNLVNQKIHVFPAMFENHIRHGLCGCCIYNETTNEIFSPTGQFLISYSKQTDSMLECFIHGKDSESVLNIEEKK
mgnify:CR=1 FL=1